MDFAVKRDLKKQMNPFLEGRESMFQHLKLIVESAGYKR